MVVELFFAPHFKNARGKLCSGGFTGAVAITDQLTELKAFKVQTQSLCIYIKPYMYTYIIYMDINFVCLCFKLLERESEQEAREREGLCV